MGKDKLKLIVVVGPTASGKSDLGIALARKTNGEVVSADSRQVYRGMDIGTGKVTKAQQRLARHHLLDVADPRRDFSVARYRTMAEKAIRDITKRGKVPIIVGGTGFYIDSLLGRVQFPDIPPHKELRAKLEKQSAEQLFAELKRLDPRRARNIDAKNKRRLIRALEIIMTTGRPVPQSYERKAMGYRVLWLGITWPREQLRKRIRQRLQRRLRQGTRPNGSAGRMVAEVRRLRARGMSWRRLENLGLEYRWLARYLRSEPKSYKLKAMPTGRQAISYRTMREGLLRDIVRYAKRQMTWFKRNQEIHWIGTLRQALALAKPFLS